MGIPCDQFDNLCNKSVSQSWVKAYVNPNAYTDGSRQETPRANHCIHHQAHGWLDLDPPVISGVSEVDLLPRVQQHFPTPPNSSSSAADTATPHSRMHQSSVDADNILFGLNDHSTSTVSSINPFKSPSRTTNHLTYQQLVLYILTFEIGLNITSEEDVVFLAKSSLNNESEGLLLGQRAATVESNASVSDCQYPEPGISAVLKQNEGQQEIIDTPTSYSSGYSLPYLSYNAAYYADRTQEQTTTA
ncbi:hypothetical protein BJV82DRAFT_715650 [Fennellomyces sp. T-0311]|nr:hypothetical protein BJV82DRAFT_715650 [Fennellomyces sp. T-0311]